MSWQDAVLAGVNVWFCLPLLYMLRRRTWMPPFASASTGLGIATIAVCYATLGSLGFSTIATGFTAFLWFCLVWQSVRTSRRAFR